MTQSQKIQAENRPTPTIEDYLATIYAMARDGDEVIAARLAESMDVTRSTVTVTLQRMERDGWVAGAPGKDICLTDSGTAAARSVIRRHMLTEWVLARMLKIPWANIHAEADHIEHSISDETEAQMRTNLDDPHFCPHGNPLPGYESDAAGWLALTGMQAGDKIIIRRIHETAESDHELLEFLESNGIIPGTAAEVGESLPFNQTLSLHLKKHTVALGFRTARYIYVEKVV